MSPDFSSGAGLSTLELLDARKRTGSKPGQRKDGRRLALVVEGGGMRGVIAAGMLSALEELGYRDCFDVVYGSSAGAFGRAYFIAGQARYRSSIYRRSTTRSSSICGVWRWRGLWLRWNSSSMRSVVRESRIELAPAERWLDPALAPTIRLSQESRRGAPSSLEWSADGRLT